MGKLYYILTLLNEWGFAKAKSLFVFWQWLLFVYCPLIFLDSINLWQWLPKWISPYMGILTYLSIIPVYFINKWIFFSQSKTEKVINKYQGKYPSFENAPVTALIIFHVFLPIALFIGIFYLTIKVRY